MPEDMKRLNVSIPASLHTKLKITATIQEKTLSQWVIEALQDKLQKETKVKEESSWQD